MNVYVCAGPSLLWLSGHTSVQADTSDIGIELSGFILNMQRFLISLLEKKCVAHVGHVLLKAVSSVSSGSFGLTSAPSAFTGVKNMGIKSVALVSDGPVLLLPT